MGQPAARLTDLHTCPLSDGPKPHVGGPISGPGVPNVLIGGLPAVVVGDLAICNGPPDAIVKGSTGVLIGGRQVARQGDLTSHGGVISGGCPTVLIGDTMPAIAPIIVGKAVAKEVMRISAQVGVMIAAALRGTPFCEICERLAPHQEESVIEKTGWVELDVVDDDGNPVVGERYEIRLQDGSIRSGVTDSNGRIRVDGIDEGTCQISLPDIDEDLWDLE